MLPPIGAMPRQAHLLYWSGVKLVRGHVLIHMKLTIKLKSSQALMKLHCLRAQVLSRGRDQIGSSLQNRAAD